MYSYYKLIFPNSYTNVIFFNLGLSIRDFVIQNGVVCFLGKGTVIKKDTKLSSAIMIFNVLDCITKGGFEGK